MDVREKLVELIAQKVCGTWSESCDEWLPHDCGKCYANDCHISEIADHLIAHGVTVQEWISVNDPPTKQGWYHVAIKDLKTGKYRVENDLYAIETAIAQGHNIGFCKEKAWPERDKLTHWCHYPQPPKG